MARALARGSSSTCRNPVLSLWTVVSSALSNVFSVEFQIFDVSTDENYSDPVQVYPATPGDRATVDVGLACPAPGAGRVRTGQYVANWTPGLAEPIGRHRIVWYVVPADGDVEEVYAEEFDVLPQGMVMPSPSYASLSDLRDEGVLPSDVSDRRALQLLTRASRQIEMWTGRFFEPRWIDGTFDGTGSSTHLLDMPILYLYEANFGDGAIDPSLYSVFNRQVSQSIVNPDDRAVPRISFRAGMRWLRRSWYPLDGYLGAFPQGVRNISLSGVFGYTDPLDGAPLGVTPDLIRQATLMLAIRNSAQLGDLEGRFEAQNMHRIRDMRTRDQSVSYGNAGTSSSTGGAYVYSGDPEIDAIIELFAAPPFIGSA